jgi:hypothetical protein
MQQTRRVQNPSPTRSSRDRPVHSYGRATHSSDELIHSCEQLEGWVNLTVRVIRLL